MVNRPGPQACYFRLYRRLEAELLVVTCTAWLINVRCHLHLTLILSAIRWLFCHVHSLSLSELYPLVSCSQILDVRPLFNFHLSKFYSVIIVAALYVWAGSLQLKSVFVYSPVDAQVSQKYFQLGMLIMLGELVGWSRYAARRCWNLVWFWSHQRSFNKISNFLFFALLHIPLVMLPKYEYSNHVTRFVQPSHTVTAQC